MTAHALAKLLLAGPDLPVVISTGSVEDEPIEVIGDLTKDTSREFYWKERGEWITGKCLILE